MKDYTELRKEFKEYRKEVIKYSFLDDNPPDFHHLDHIFPVLMGFNLGIPAKRIAHPSNLQWLLWKDNQDKGALLVNSLEEFFEYTKDWEDIVERVYSIRNEKKTSYIKNKKEEKKNLVSILVETAENEHLENDKAHIKNLGLSKEDIEAVFGNISTQIRLKNKKTRIFKGVILKHYKKEALEHQLSSLTFHSKSEKKRIVNNYLTVTEQKNITPST